MFLVISYANLENDTLRLTYDFNGEGGPMSVNIYNKSTRPLYVNWKKSALFRDEHSVSLFVVPDTTQKLKLADSRGYGELKYRQLSFDENGSPLRFRSYLTFVLGSSESQEFAESSSFYVNQLWQSNTGPEQFSMYQQQGNQLFVRFPAQANP